MKIKSTICLVALVLTSCTTYKKVDLPTSTGRTTKEVQQAVKSMTASVKTIDAEATSILVEVPEGSIANSAKQILSANREVANTGSLISTEALSKVELLTKYEELTKKYNKLVEDRNSGFGKFKMFLSIIGGLMIPAGLFLGFRLSKEFLWLSVVGVIVIVTSSLIAFIEKNYLWVAGLVLVAIVYAFVKQYLIQGKATFEATKVAEIVKAKLKDVDMEAVTTLFGEGTIPGVIRQDDVTKGIILAARKKILTEAKPTGSMLA
jgi:hypothetical protein